MKRNLLTLLTLSLILAGCGQEKAPGTDPVVTPPVSSPDAQVRLVLFGAAWCSTCSRDIPNIQADLKADLGKNVTKVEMALIVPTGATPAKRPEDSVTEAYGKKLNFEGSVTSDAWRWKYFRKVLPGAALSLPAAVLVDLDGNVLERYPPNTFSPADIVADAKAQVK